MTAFIFPGQGSQKVGMGADLAEASAHAREVFQEVDEALKQNLSRLMFKGPDDELALTENAQPAIMAVSLAVIRVLSEDGGIDLSQTAAFVAGHSLGEYTALTAAGAFQLADAARILKTRGQAMQAAVPVGEGAMAALLDPVTAKAAPCMRAASAAGSPVKVIAGWIAAVSAPAARSGSSGATPLAPLTWTIRGGGDGSGVFARASATGAIASSEIARMIRSQDRTRSASSVATWPSALAAACPVRSRSRPQKSRGWALCGASARPMARATRPLPIMPTRR